MSIKWKKGRPYVEAYDPAVQDNVYVKPRDFGMEHLPAGASKRALTAWARELEQLAVAQFNAGGLRGPDETIGSFGARWPDDYVIGQRGKVRSESTREHNRERVRAFTRKHEDRTVRSFTREEARAWANGHPGAVPALKAMWADAVSDGLAERNVFERLGRASSGRADITVLTADELELLTACARSVHPGPFGARVAAMITWLAYTAMRPGEAFAARWSALEGDTFHVRTQYNSRLRKETVPKHESVGTIFVPAAALEAVHALPRELGEDLIFQTKRGRQFRQTSWHEAWVVVRAAFMAKLPASHHLHERLAVDVEDRFDTYELRHFGASYQLNVLGIEPWVIAKQLRQKNERLVLELYGHPDRGEAIDRIRRAYNGVNVTSIDAARAARGASAS